MLKQAIPVLHRDNIEAARAFSTAMGFTERFAFQLDPASAEPDPCYMGIERDGVVIHISSFPGDGVSGNPVYIIVESVDGLYAELLERGLSTEMEPVDQTWGNREVYFEDPSGNSIRFVEEG